jgi:hypothetical protein
MGLSNVIVHHNYDTGSVRGKRLRERERLGFACAARRRGQFDLSLNLNLALPPSPTLNLHLNPNLWPAASTVRSACLWPILRGMIEAQNEPGIRERKRPMSRVMLDAQLRSKLNGLDDQVEICDESGQTLGRFLPESLYRELLLAWAKADLPDEELQRRRQEPAGRTLAEIWEKLGQQ